LVVLSSKCEQSLAEIKENLSEYMASGSSVPISDIAYTLAVGRQSYSQRAFAIATDDQLPLNYLNSRTALQANSKLAWVFPGQGTQHLGMSLDLYRRFKVFREAVDSVCEQLGAYSDIDIKSLLIAEFANEELARQLNTTLYSQPAIFTHSFAVAQLLFSWGISPNVILGHSLVEYVAVCLSGALSLDQTISLVVKRAELMNSIEPGDMLAVSASVERVSSMLENEGNRIDIAAINSATMTVVSGVESEIESAQNLFRSENLDATKLVTSHAFHSRMLDPVLGDFESFVSTLQFSDITLPFISSLTGGFATLEEISSPQYWVRHLRETVQFERATGTLIEEECEYVLDLGPSTTASTLLRDNIAADNKIQVINCSKNPKSTVTSDQALLQALGQYWCDGGDVKWNEVYRDRDCYRAALPTYPFQKKRHWIDASLPVQRNNSNEPRVVARPQTETKKVTENGGDYAPRNGTEQMVADIWLELLGVSEVGIHDNFFELGGQSLLASRVMTRIYEETSVELDVSVIFDAPTIESVAMAILNQQAASVSDGELEQLLAELEN